MKKVFFSLLFLIILQACAISKEILAPALELDITKYEDYFKKPADYKIELKSRSDYKITCDADIIGVVIGDRENIKVFDIKNDNDEIDMKTVLVKLKYETYSYLRLYKSSKEVVNIILSVNPLYRGDFATSLGLCELTPYRGE